MVTVLAGLGKGSCKEGCRAYGKRPASRTVASRREPNRYLIQIPLRLSQQPKRCGTSPQSRSGIDRWYEAAAVRSSRLGRRRCAAAPGACGSGGYLPVGFLTRGRESGGGRPVAQAGVKPWRCPLRRMEPSPWLGDGHATEAIPRPERRSSGTAA